MKRNYGIDLLRILTMLMVVMLHVLGIGGILDELPGLGIKNGIVWLLEVISYCAVDCYALISGFVGINARFRYSSIIMLWFQAVFYSLGITILFFVFFNNMVGMKEWFTAFFPISFNYWWYLRAYVCVALFFPLLNNFVRSLSESQMLMYLVTFIGVFSVYQTLRTEEIFGTANGYSAIWLALLYIAGGCLNLTKDNLKSSKKVLLFGWFICIFSTWSWKFLAEYSSNLLFGETKGVTILVNYISPTILACAIILVLLFSEMTIPKHLEKIISIIAPLSFGVYLIHTHPLIFNNLFKNRFVSFIQSNVFVMTFEILFTVIGIFIIGCIVDKIRLSLFKALHLKELATRIEKKVKSIFVCIGKLENKEYY